MSTLGITEELLGGSPAPAAKPVESPASLGIAEELIRGPELRPGPGPKDKSQIADIADDPKRAVPTLTLLRAGFFPDDNKKLDYLAQETGIPRERWGVVDGNIVYADPKTDRYVRAVPSVVKGSNPIDLWHRGTQWLADNLVPAVPGAVGGAVGTMMGPTPASIPAAAATAGAVDAGRQAIGNMMLEGDQGSLSDIDWLNVLGQTAGGGAGQAIPTGLIRATSRNPMKISPYDRSAAMDPETLARARQAAAEAEAQGVPLTFGQSTQIRSAMSGERQLAKDPASMDTMDMFYNRQRELLGDAVRRKADEFSPVQSVDEGVGRMREGAAETVDQARMARNRVADPLYEAARQSDAQVDVSPILADLDGRISVAKGPIKDALTKARALLVQEGPEGKIIPESRVEALHQAKIALDAMMEGRGQDAIGNTAKRELKAVQNSLLDTLDNAVPEYAAARQAYRAASPAVSELTDGTVGRLAGQEGEAKIGEIRNLFNANLTNPAAVNKARMAYERSGRIEDWNAGLATWLRDALDASTKTNKGGMLSARDLVSQVYRDENQKKLLKAAMTSEQFDGFTRLMNVVQNVARTMPEGSPTATDTAGMAALREQFGSKVKMGQKLMNLQIGDALLDRATLRLSDSGMAKLAEAVTSPQNVEQLKKLRMMDPRSEKAAVLVGQMTGAIAVPSLGGRDARGGPPAMPKQDRQ